MSDVDGERRTEPRRRAVVALLLCLLVALWVWAAQAKPKPRASSHRSSHHSCPLGRGHHGHTHRTGQCRPGSPATADLSGEPMPVGDIPGWHRVFADDFAKNAPLGAFASSGNGPVYEGDHGGKWGSYGDGWACPPWPNCYHPAQVVSVHDGVLDFWLHNVNGAPAGATLSPYIAGDSSVQTYGRFVVRFKVVYEDSRRLDQYHIAWLLWPARESDWQVAESDFPEADLSQTSVCAYAHGPSPGEQQERCTGIDLSQWHTFVQEWKPGERRYLIDGKLVGGSPLTAGVYAGPEFWALQTEAHARPGDSTSGHLLVDWVTAYALAGG
jgi:hypothetical protein